MNKTLHRMALVIIGSIYGLLASSSVLSAQQEVPRIRIEQSMREYNGRYHHFFPNSYVRWPQCGGCGGKQETPPKPYDGFYPDSQVKDPTQCVELVQALVNAFYDQPIYGNFMMVEGVNAPPFPSYTVNNFPRTWGATVTINNYVRAFNTVTGYIGQLRTITSLAGSQVGIDDNAHSTIESRGSNDQGMTLQAAKDSVLNNSSYGWYNVGWMDISDNYISSSTYLSEIKRDDNPDRVGFAAGVAVDRGRVYANLASQTGTAVCYIRVWNYSDKFSLSDNAGITIFPPDTPTTPFNVKTDDKYHLWKSNLNTGSPFYSEPINSTDTPPAWPSNPPAAIWPGNTVSSVAWYLDGIVVGISPDFNTRPAGPEHCPASCGSGSCPAGSAGDSHVELGSVSYTIGLGRVDDQASAGYLYIDEESPSAALATPAVLQISVSSDSRLELIRSSGADTPVRQVKTPLSLTDVVIDSATQYHINFYHAEDVEKVNGLWQPLMGKTPYKTITLLSPGGNVNQLRITETQDATSKARLFRWDVQDSLWELADGLSNSDDLTTAQRREVLKKMWNTDHSQRTETRTIKNGDGAMVSKVVRVYQIFLWGEELVQEMASASTSADPDADVRTTTWQFYAAPTDSDDDHDNYSHLKAYISDCGYWEHYTYGTDGAMTRKITQYGNNPYDDSDVGILEADNVLTLYTTTSAALANMGDSGDEVIQETIESKSGESSVYHYQVTVSGKITINNVDYYDVWDVVCSSSDPLNGYGSTTAFLEALFADANYLGQHVTKTRRYAATDANGTPQTYAFDVAQSESSDGTMTFYTRTTGQTVVISGTPNANKDGITYGTRQTTVVDSQGNTLWSKTERCETEGNWFVISLSKTLQQDVFGRPTQRGYYFGSQAVAESGTPGSGTARYTTSTAYGCCGVDTITDRSGLQTHYVYDALGRQTEVTDPVGITMHTTYDAADRMATEVQEGTDTSTLPVQTNAYDLLGRTTSQKDAEGKFTFYTYRLVVADTGNEAFGEVLPEGYTGPVYQETRVYPHNAASGPIQITWTDSHGRTVRAWTASATATWNTTGDGSSPPLGSEVLTELTRTTYVYDWADRAIETRQYYLLPDFNANGAENTNYYAQRQRYTLLGQLVGSRDAMGNISAYLYDSAGRQVTAWQGTGDVATFNNMTLDGSTPPTGLNMVSKTIYDSHGQVSRTYRVGAVTAITSAYDADPLGSDYVATDYSQSYDTNNEYRLVWAKPAAGGGPWTEQIYDYEGRLLKALIYANGDTNTLLAQSEQGYGMEVTTSAGKQIESRQYSVENSVASSYLSSQTIYDNVGRPYKASTIGGGFSKTIYDAQGRVERSLVCSAPGSVESTNGDYHAGDYADDMVLSETVNAYDGVGNVIQTTTYTRRDDAGTYAGLLSSDPSKARVTYVCTWYDDAHRPTHVANYGTTNPDQ